LEALLLALLILPLSLEVFLKSAVVTPIQKTKESTELSNFRPISVLPVNFIKSFGEGGL